MLHFNFCLLFFPDRTAFLYHPPFSRSTNVPPPAKKRRQATPKNTIYSRNVVCLPPAKDRTKPIPIPRGDSRAWLNEAGLIGRVAIDSFWKANEVEHEISTTFASSFFLPDGDILTLNYLRYVVIVSLSACTFPCCKMEFNWQRGPHILR